ncbi:hypothetical protein A2592_02960 [Candidatus Kaiserbacteria bacterium RIFOXYD1_FULL_42_15]|uniref:Uncharacterized protein n=1 Tax=Candidatus Kaiserbacteria bacterium RIFOXYD1_FULL_42_15 TaxID=1798532 RepID=A0A1F6FTZ5_9BACT|nr:MAG: hypothetical protein A2592_02960 [Candidatus Kaiserbacteria bacterium RIFOXYD1_FULL_42_15]
MLPHHAIVCITDSRSELPFDLVELALVSEIVNITTITLSIAEVRRLIERAYQTPFERSSQTFIIDVTQIAVEAQHALLKILEEPPVTSRFIFSIRPETTLLPTLRSRLHEIKRNEPAVAVLPTEFMEFLTASIGERMAIITKVSKDKDVVFLANLATGLTLWLQQNSLNIRDNKSAQLLLCLTSLQMRGAGKKMLWEDIALQLPIKKTSG